MLKSDNVTIARPAVYPDAAGKVLVSDGTYEITAALNVHDQIIALCILPIGCMPLDFTVVIDGIDTSTGLKWTGGGIIAAETSVDKIMIAETTVGRSSTAGSARASLWPIEAPVTVETFFGIHLTDAPTTAAAGTIRGILTYRSAEYGV